MLVIKRVKGQLIPSICQGQKRNHFPYLYAADFYDWTRRSPLTIVILFCYGQLKLCVFQVPFPVIDLHLKWIMHVSNNDYDAMIPTVNLSFHLNAGDCPTLR